MSDAVSREKVIADWFKVRDNQILFGIILFAILIRIYYFSLTQSQPLWWDEADYLSIAKSWIGVVNWEYNAVRPVLLPLIASIAFKLGLGENFLRFGVILSSVLSIPLIYGIGRIMFNKRAGLVAAFILSVFWSVSFYSHRILTDVPVMFLWLGTIYFLLKGIEEKGNTKLMAIGGIFLTLSFLMKYSSAVLIIILGIYSLTTKKGKILKDKGMLYFWGSSLVSVIPFFLWQKMSFGSFLAFLTTATGEPKARPFIESLINQTLFSVELMHFVLVGLFLIGLVITLFDMFIEYDFIFKERSRANKSYLLLLWLVLSLLFFGWLNYGNYMDERYYFIFYPAIFLFAANFVSKLSFWSDRNKIFSGVVIIMLVFAGVGYQQIPHGDSIIKTKIDSFRQIKDAGEWVNVNSEVGRVSLVTEEFAELTYYTERQLYQANNISELNELIDEYDPKYIIVSFYYTPGYPQAIEMIQSIFQDPSRFVQVQAYGPAVDRNGQIPMASVFEII